MFQVALAAEFLAGYGRRQSPGLQRLLWRFRGAPLAGKYALICTKPDREWRLIRLSGVRGEPLTPVPGKVFRSLAEAERAVFRLRWREATGRELP